MIQKISGMPADVAAFRLTGQITREDYETIVLPTVDIVAAQSEHIQFMLVIDTDLSNFTIGAWMQDAYIGFRHFAKFRRVAIVSDSKVEEKMTHFANKIVPQAEFKSYPLSQEAAARQWIGGISAV